MTALQDIFDLLMAQRRVRQSSYIRHQNWHSDGQEGLQGEHAAVLLMKETLTISSSNQIVAQYAVTTAPLASAEHRRSGHPGHPGHPGRQRHTRVRSGHSEDQ